MATEGGGKIKSKRSQASNKPYERNSSLFGKLKNSVKDLLIPSWLSRSNEGDPHGKEETRHSSQASTSAHSNAGLGYGPESSSLQYKANDRISPLEQQPSHFVNQTPEHADLGLPGTSEQVQSSNSLLGEPYMDPSNPGQVPNVNIASLDRQEANWRLKKPDLSSGSNLPGFQQPKHQQKNTDPVSPKTSDSYSNEADQEVDVSSVRPIMITTGGPNRSLNLSQPASKRQRLWSPESARQGKPLAAPVKEKPAFNSLLFGSPNKSNLSALGDSFRESSFYPGKTRFGGASAERRSSFNTSLPYQSSLPLRKQVRANKLNNSFNATTSATAQRILETLDRMSTPLGDARKIPQAQSANDSVLSFTPSSYRRLSLMGSARPVTRPLQIPNKGPPTSQHQALSQAVIAKNRHKAAVIDRRHVSSNQSTDGETVTGHLGLSISQEPTAVREITEKLIPQGSQANTAQPSGGMGKMKSKRFSQHISGRGAVDDEVVEVPNLRTDFTLPISNINPISFPSHPVKSHTLAATSIPPADKLVPLTFTFSTPIEEKQRPVCNQVLNSVDKGFKFSSPIKASQSKTSAAGAEEGSKFSPEPAVGASSGVSLQPSSAAFPAPVPAWGSVAPKPKAASPDIGGTSSSFKSINKWNSFSKNSDSSAASDVASPAGFALAPASSLKIGGSVMDILGKSSSLPSTQASSSAPKEDDLMAKFKKPPGTWECDVCMLANKPGATRCVACETPKAGAKQTNKPAAPVSLPQSAVTTVSNDLMAKFKKPPGTWECDVCMIQNKPDVTKCVACETPKPGAKQAPPSTSTSSKTSLSALFKKPPGNWECDTCMVQNTATATRCIACETPKPGLQSAGIVSKPSGSSSTSTAISISPDGGFTINIPASTATAVASSGFKFGNTNSSSTPSTSTIASTGFVFGQTSSKTDSTTGSVSASGSSASVPPSVGFKFGTTGTVNDSGGTAPGTLNVPKVGFVFGSTAAGTGSINSNDTSSGTRPGAAATGPSSDSSIIKFGSSASGSVIKSQSDTLSNSNSTTELNKSNNFVGPSPGGFQFGSASGIAASSGPQPIFGADSKDSATKPAEQSKVNFSAPAPSALPSTFTVAATAAEKTESVAAAKPATNFFQFGGTATSGTASTTGLGMGKSLSDSKPMVNGRFGAGLESQTTKDVSKPALQDTSKPGGFPFGSPAPIFGNFSPAPAPVPPVAAAPQSTQANKRSVDFVAMGAPSAKKSFSFGTNNNEPAANGLFGIGNAADSKASPFGANAPAGLARGGFRFPSSLPSTQAAPAPGGGFQFAAGSAAPAPAPALSTGFSFSVKTPSEAPKPVFEVSAHLPANKGTFGTASNFNFGGGTQTPSGTPFQFGGKPVENSVAAPASGLFAFGGAPTPSFTSDGSGFGATPASGGPVGSFSIGAGDSSARRPVKKATRRLKK